MKTKQENQDFTSKKAYWGGGGGCWGIFFPNQLPKFQSYNEKEREKMDMPGGGGGEKIRG